MGFTSASSAVISFGAKPASKIFRKKLYVSQNRQRVAASLDPGEECILPNRFRVELMLIESFKIGRLDFPNRDTLKSTHCFLPNEMELSHRWRRRGRVACMRSILATRSVEHKASRRSLHRMVRQSSTQGSL